MANNFFKATKAKVLTKLDMTRLKLRKNAPEIMIFGGIILTTASIIVACKKTLKMPEIVDAHKEDMKNINIDEGTGEITKEESRAQKFAVTKRTVLRTASNYILPFMSFTTGTILIIGGAVKGRNMRNDLAADLSATMGAFALYRDRIRERLGEEAEADIYYGRNTVHYTKMNEDGTTEEKDVKTFPKSTGHPLEFIFNDQTSSKFEHGEMGTKYNFTLLKSVLANVKDELTAPWGGRPIRLNYVLNMLGFKEEGKYDNYGWLPESLGGTVRDVSFGLEKYSDGDGGIDIPIDGELILEFNAEFISDKY